METFRRAERSARRRTRTSIERARRRHYPSVIRSTWGRVRAEQLSYTTDAQLHQLLRVVRATDSSGALIIETGCARGGSAIVLCAAKRRDHPMRVYDVFDMIPPPSEHDGADMKAPT